jgi:hypothetical protein
MEPMSRVISKAVLALVTGLIDIAVILSKNNSELSLFLDYFFLSVMSVPSTGNFFPLYREKSRMAEFLYFVYPPQKRAEKPRIVKKNRKKPRIAIVYGTRYRKHP